jgi:hypothetical protein
MTEAYVLTASRRPLTEGQRRYLRARIRSFGAGGRRASVRALAITGAAIVALWIWTLLASDAVWPVVTAFWLLAGSVVALLVHRSVRADEQQLTTMTDGLGSALRRNEADVYDILSTAYVELEEVEDEGACYAFQIEADRLVFVTGQEFYEAARFPSLDFSLVYVLDEGGRPVDMLIDKRGSKAPPARRVPPAVKGTLDPPEHLEVRSGRLDDLERILAVRRRT